MSGRGMMKWAPFQSLSEQASYLYRMRKKEAKVERPLISQDIAEEINNILVNYHGEELKIKLYDDGEIFEIVAKISRIDVNNKCLYIEDNKLEFKDLLGLSSI